MVILGWVCAVLRTPWFCCAFDSGFVFGAGGVLLVVVIASCVGLLACLVFVSGVRWEFGWALIVLFI